jgi:Domain of unknown function (DUF4265)
MKQQSDMTKVLISSSDGDETLWATPVGAGQYRLENIPFQNYGYAFGDVVQTVPQTEGFPIVTAAAVRSQHSAFRVFVAETVESIDALDEWKALHQLRCTYERATKRLFAIDVPAGVNMNDVERFLQEGETNKNWDYEEVFAFRG